MRLNSGYHAGGYFELLLFDGASDAISPEQLIHRGVPLDQCICNIFLLCSQLESGDFSCLERVRLPAYSATKSVVFPFMDSSDCRMKSECVDCEN